MDWDDLRYLLAVKRAHSLAGAARSLKVRHTTVGRRIGALEVALGARLVTRTPDGLVLTAAGEDAAEAARQMEDRALEVERRLGGGDRRVEGRVRITTPQSFGPTVARALPALRERYPGLEIEILSDNRVFDLARGEADLAVRVGRTPQAGLLTRKLGDAGWSLYGSEAYVARKGTPKNPRTLQGHDFVGFEGPLAGSQGAAWFASHGAGCRVVLRCNTIADAVAAVAEGVGLSVLPCLAAADSHLRRLTSEVLGSTDITLVCHPDLKRSARVRAVIDRLVEHFKREAPAHSGAAPGFTARPRPTT